MCGAETSGLAVRFMGRLEFAELAELAELAPWVRST